MDLRKLFNIDEIEKDAQQRLAWRKTLSEALRHVPPDGRQQIGLILPLELAQELADDIDTLIVIRESQSKDKH